MDTKDIMTDTRTNAARCLIEWAVVGLPSTLASSVSAKLTAIAHTGLPRADDMEWVLFGEVVGACAGPPPTVHLRRLPMLVNDPESQKGNWDTWDLVCPTSHDRVDFSIGMQIGILAKPSTAKPWGRLSLVKTFQFGMCPPFIKTCHGMYLTFSQVPMRDGYAPCGGSSRPTLAIRSPPTRQLTGVLK